MRISIDATGLGSYKTGTAVYLCEILKVWNQDSSIDHEFFVFSNADARRHLSDIGLDDRFQFLSAPSHRYLRVLWQQLVMPLHIRRIGIDVHWGAGFVLPLLSAKPMVVTVHDLTFQLFPVVHEYIKRYYFPAIINAAVRKARTVIAISESTRHDLNRLISSSHDKCVVTLLAARTMRSAGLVISPDHGRVCDSDYILFVGTVEPRKNLDRLVSAWNLLDTGVRSGVRLIVVGATGWLVDSLVGHLKETEAIEFRGHVDDVELIELMRGAMAFVYPSLYEGFGLPVVEAMSLGIPVLTSNIGATREVADGAAILVDPMSVEDIRAGIETLISDPDLRRSLAILGQLRASSYSWARTAQQTIELIEQAGYA